MITDTRERIVKLVEEKGRVTAKEMVEYLGITRQGLFLQIAKLLRNKEIAKMGKSPLVYYYLPEKMNGSGKVIVDSKIADFVNERYLYISPLGEKKFGMAGFSTWCQKTGQELTKTAKEYVLTQTRYDKWVHSGVIDGTAKLKSTFPKVYLDKLLYLDFYSIERFGKTKLGQLLLYAKQSQSREMISELVSLVQPSVERIVEKYGIASIGYIPPTVRREVQLMRELERQIGLPLRKIKIEKIRSEMMIPQKTLSRLADRVENAKRTMMIRGNELHDNTLLIDDAVGSGATLNETAKQMRERGMVKGKIIGLAIVGSYKGFDVISEV